MNPINFFKSNKFTNLRVKSRVFSPRTAAPTGAQKLEARLDAVQKHLAEIHEFLHGPGPTVEKSVTTTTAANRSDPRPASALRPPLREAKGSISQGALLASSIKRSKAVKRPSLSENSSTRPVSFSLPKLTFTPLWEITPEEMNRIAREAEKPVARPEPMSLKRVSGSKPQIILGSSAIRPARVAKVVNFSPVELPVRTSTKHPVAAQNFLRVSATFGKKFGSGIEKSFGEHLFAATLTPDGNLYSSAFTVGFEQSDREAREKASFKKNNLTSNLKYPADFVYNEFDLLMRYRFKDDSKTRAELIEYKKTVKESPLDPWNFI